MSLNSYIKSIPQTNKLTKGETNKLLIDAQNGDIGARNKIVEDNLGLVIRIAERWGYLRYSNIMDLIQEGNIGLINSINLYDSDRKVEFPACAVWNISKCMFRYLQNTGKTIRIPVYLQEKVYKIVRKLNLGKKLTDKEEKILRKGRIEMISLDKRISDESEEDIYTLIGEESSILDVLCSEEREERFLNALETLKSREKDIMLDRFQGETLRTIAKKQGISYERVRQIVDNCVMKLQREVKE